MTPRMKRMKTTSGSPDSRGIGHLVLFILGLAHLLAAGLSQAEPATLLAESSPPPLLAPFPAPAYPLASSERVTGVFHVGTESMESPSSACGSLPCWGPGDPTVYTRYFRTISDSDNGANPVYVNAGGLVPRTAYSLEMWSSNPAFTIMSPPGAPPWPEFWFYYFFDRSGQQLLYWYRVARWDYYWEEIATSDGQSSWYHVYGGYPGFLRLGMEVGCNLPDGGYTLGLQYIFTVPGGGQVQAYFMTFPYTLGGGPQDSCGPAGPVALSPSGCVTNPPPSLTWTAGAGASYYKVWVTTGQGQVVVDGARVNAPTTTYPVPSGLLQAGREYRWYVRSGNSHGESGNSNVLAFTPQCGAPAVPLPIAPSGCVSTTTPTLSWSASSGAESYTAQVLDSQTGQVVRQGTVAGTTMAVQPPLDENHDYTWQVLATNAYGSSSWSTPTAFTPFCGAPATPAPIGPSGCITGTTPTISWQAAARADNYQLFVQEADTPGEPVRFSYYGPLTQKTIGSNQALADDTRYRWKVRSENTYGASDYSVPLFFIPNCGQPKAPTLLAPFECVDDDTPEFSWTSDLRATSYRLVVRNEAGATVIDRTQAGTTFTPATPLPADTLYTWTVVGLRNGQPGPTSETGAFIPHCSQYEEEADTRPEDSGGTSCEDLPPSSRGKPVSVVSGNMYFDQADVAVSGVGSLVFARSYNSANILAERHGIFGPGWSHPFEESMSFRFREVTLREPDGTVLYFADTNRDDVYEPTVPATEESKIVKLVDGTYERRFRFGGAEAFDASGRLTAIVDRVGNRTSVIRNGSTGRLDAVRDPGGRQLTFGYTGARLTSVAVAGITRATYGYDASERLETVTYADGTGYRYVYDGAGRILAVQDLLGKVLESHTYYEDGRARTSSVADDRELLTFAYDNQSTTVTDALGSVTTYDFANVEHMRRITRITGPCPSCGGGGGEVQEWTYDGVGRVATHKTADGQSTTFTYDPLTGDVRYRTDALRNTTIYTYYPDGRVKTITGADGARRGLTYVDAGPATITDAIDDTHSRTTTIEYNPLGKPERLTDARGKATLLRYDGWGDLREREDAEGNITKFTYDEMGRVHTVTDADDKTAVTDYDLRGRVRKVMAPDQTFVEYTYDSASRLVTATDSLGRVTKTGYDPYGRPEFAIDALGGVTTQGFDLMSRLVSIKDARGNETRFDRDGYGRVIRTTYPSGAVEAFTYDDRGRLDTRTDRRGVVTTYAYDAVDRLLRKSYSDGTPAVDYTYDVAGKMLTASSAVDSLSWTYDLLGRTLTESSQRHGTTLSYGYDEASNRKSLSIDGTLFLEYDYDDLSRLWHIRQGGKVFEFDYDVLSRRWLLRFPNGVLTVYKYDPEGMSRLTSLDITHSGETVSLFKYTYDDAGNRTRKEVDALAEDYGYDPLDRLRSVERPGLARRFGYDAVGNRTTEDVNGNVVTTIYDNSNRLQSRSAGGSVTVAGTVNESAFVTVNTKATKALPGFRFEGEIQVAPGANPFTVTATDLAGNPTSQNYNLDVTAQSDYQSTYDANGNLETRHDLDGILWRYEWDAENRLTRVLRNAVETARFAYDPLGRRVEKAAAGVTTAYIYDGIDIFRERRTQGATTTTATYVHGPGIDEPLARADSVSGWRYYHADGLGSIVKLTNDSGAVVHTYQYDAWGNIEVGASEPGYAFTGREWDPEIGLYYYRARYYNAEIGRFISEDPIGFASGTNFYAYVGNRPVSGRDPLGLVDFTGDPSDVRQAYAQQELLRNNLTPKVLDYFRRVFDANLKEYLTPGMRGTFALKKQGPGASGHCSPDYFVWDPDAWINMSLDQFSNGGLLFQATLLHELVHLADHNDFWSESYSFTDEETRRAKEGLRVNPLHGLEAYYAEVFQFGRVVTTGH